MHYVGWALVPDVPFHYSFFTDGSDWTIVQCEVVPTQPPEIIQPDEMVTWDFHGANGYIPPFCTVASRTWHHINPIPLDEWIQIQVDGIELCAKNARDYEMREQKYRATQETPTRPEGEPEILHRLQAAIRGTGHSIEFWKIDLQPEFIKFTRDIAFSQQKVEQYETELALLQYLIDNATDDDLRDMEGWSIDNDVLPMLRARLISPQPEQLPLPAF